MKSTKKREIGLGDNLYGIPLDDILTPDELSQMRKDTSAMNRRKRREKKKRTESKKINFNKIKIPKIKFTKNVRYILAVIAVMLLLFLILKKPITARITPKMYVGDALKETVLSVENETQQIMKGVFGFDLFDEKELTVSASGGVDADSNNMISDLSVNIEAGYSKKSSNAIARWQYLHSGEEFVSSTVYLNDEEVGFNVPQLFGEYWTAPAKSFGKEWNESGLRKVLYADAVGEDADISFSNTFCRQTFISAQGKKDAEHLTEKLISSAKAKYNGKTEIAINGESKLARSFVFEFEQQDIISYFVQIKDLIFKDSELSKSLSAAGELDRIQVMLDDISSRLAGSIKINDARLTFAVYKDAVRSCEVYISYAENGNNPIISALLSSESLKHITDDIKFWINVTGSDNDFSYTLSTNGNHNGSGKKFTDSTTVTLSNGGYNYSLNSDIALDLKDGSVSGSITGEDIYSTKTLIFGGTCAKKNGLKIELADVSTETSGNYPRTIAGKLNVSIVPDMTISKINTSNKKLILDYSKAEAENYLMRLEQTDSVKNLIATVNSIFNKAE
ncbi:MAG: hypothetical protein IJN62_05695 [Clostridia bacterium]|nr:hypothetical protein [Clostridia bacterium]